MTIRLLLRRSKAEGQEASLDVQRAGCATFATARGLTGSIVEYVGDGVAGDDIEGLRALRALLDDARRGDVVICRDHSRLGRDMLSSATTIRTLIEENGAKLFYYSTGEEVQWRGATDAAMSVLRGFGAQMELESIRSRTREALRERVKAGRLAGGACYGYDLRRVVENGREYTVAVVNGEQAKIILRIFREYVGGAGLKAIAIGLNNDGIPGPRAKRRGSGSWSPGQVRDILRRERYIGVYVHGAIDRKKKNGKRVARRADPAQVMRVEVPEWRIVDDLLWRRAQAIIGERAPSAKSDSRSVHPLSGLAKCAHCGGSIGVVRTKVVDGLCVRSYGCVRHFTRGAAVCPVAVSRPTDAVESALADAIRVACERPDVVEVILAAMRAEVEAESLAAATIDTEGLEAELLQARREAHRLARAIAMTDGDIPELVTEMRARSHRAAEIERAMAVANRAPIEAAGMVAAAEDALRAQLADLRAALAADPTATRDLYRGLFGHDGLRFEADPTAKPARFIVRGAVDLSKRLVTPAGIEPAFSA